MKMEIKKLQENYEIEIAQNLSGAIKDFLQQMMNVEFNIYFSNRRPGI